MWVLILSSVVLICWAVYLSLFDVHFHRLPDPLTLPVAVSAVLCAAVWEPQVLLSGLAWAGLYLLVGLLVGGVGGGDLKLAVPLGILVSAVGGLGHVLAACGLAAGLGAVVGIVLGIVRGEANHAHGPPMMVAAAVVMGVALG